METIYLKIKKIINQKENLVCKKSSRLSVADMITNFRGYCFLSLAKQILERSPINTSLYIERS